MKLITNNEYQCVAASFAMVMDTTIEDIFKRVGHNGLDNIINDVPEPTCYRGFHPQEFVDILLEDGYSMTMVELDPLMKHGPHIISHGAILGRDRFFLSLSVGSGVIFGTVDNPCNGRGHAVAWDSETQKVFDPRGYTFRWNEGQDFYPKQFFLIQKVAEYG